jgi:recombination protein RecR
MEDLAKPMSRLVDELKRLPGVGQKSAQRMAFHLLGAPAADAERLAQAILEMRGRIQLCSRCNNISEGPLCGFCNDPNRDKTTVCVVEQPNNIMIIERTRQYNAGYHVLHGALSPLRNIGPEELKL